MYDTHQTAYEEEWVIWNTANGLLTTVTIGQIEIDADGRTAWLDEPFDMVGPFSLDELETHGLIAFAACLVMSRHKWNEDQAALQQESLKIRRAAEERARERVNRTYNNHNENYNRDYNDHQPRRQPYSELEHRKTLMLPIDGKLDPRQIKAAFRRLAQKAHPDVGGSKEKFVRITEARNALLEYNS